MKEIEVKIIEIDREKVEKKLRSLGATKTFDGNVETNFLDFPDRSITKANNLLRLRRIGGKTELVFKKFLKSDSAKVREEYEVSISDFQKMCEILKLIGLISIQENRKHRTSYVLEPGVSVDIDKYVGEFSHIPEFMEIECKNIKTIYRCAKLLGFDRQDCRPWTTPDLINYYSEGTDRRKG